MEKRQVGRTGLMIDALGLGGAPLGGNFIDLDYRQAAELIQAAKDAGIGYFDTAPWYGFGRSERVMGDLLRHTDYILSDKVGRLLKPGPVDNPADFGMVDPLPFHVVYDYGYDGIMRAFEDNLQRLGLDRIDILLAHDIGTFTHGEDNARHFRDLAEGGYRWNAGMFVARPAVLLDLLADTDPGFAADLRALAADGSRMEEIWPRLPRIAVDHAVAEPAVAAGRVATVPAAFDWEDVGDFDSLAALLGADGVPMTVLGDADVRVVDASGLVVAGGRTVAVVGLDDVVVVDTPDALLVTTRERAQDVKAVVAALKESGRADLT